MAVLPVRSPSTSSNRLLGAAPPRTVACRLWDGTRWPENAPDDVAATVVLNHPGALRRMFLPPTERAVGEAFIQGDFDIEGDHRGRL